MNRLFCCVFVVALALLACSLRVQAATETPSTTASAPTPALVKAFGVTLTPAQAEQFKAMMAAAEPQKKAIRDNAALSETDKRAQMTAIYDKLKQQLRAILTPEQVAEMDKASAAPPAPTPGKVFGVTLTPAQTEKFKAICAAEQPAEKAIRENTTLSDADKRAQMVAVYEKIKQQLKAILTPEQVAEMDKATASTAKH